MSRVEEFIDRLWLIGDEMIVEEQAMIRQGAEIAARLSNVNDIEAMLVAMYRAAAQGGAVRAVGLVAAIRQEVEE